MVGYSPHHLLSSKPRNSLEAVSQSAYSSGMMRTLAFFIFLLFPLCSHAEFRNILILHSYHPGLSWTDTLNNGIRDTFAADLPQAHLWVEYLDTKRNPDLSYLNLQAKLLAYKFRDSRFDLILVTDNNALDFARQHRQALFAEAPIVFCGVNAFTEDMRRGLKQVTGVAENPAFEETMRLALLLHPQSTEFVIIGGDQSITDMLTDQSLHALQPAFSGIRFTFWNNLNAVELRPRLERLGPGQLIFIHGVMRNEDGVLVDYREKNRFLAAHTRVPIYGFWDFEMGTGCVGGKLIEGYEQGVQGAKRALMVLNGTDPDTLPIITQPHTRHIFDYNQLVHFDIDQTKLPKDSLILNQPTRFYQIDKRFIWTALFGFALLLMALAMLLGSVRRRKEAQAVLRRHKEQLEIAVQARTEHLRAANDELEREVHERIRAEGDLRKARARLEIEVDRRTSDLRFEVEQRRLADAHIRDREAKARALINAPTETLLLMDQAGIIMDINETGAARLARNPASLFGMSLYALLDEDLGNQIHRAVDEVFTTGALKSLSVNDQDQDLELRLYPVFDDNRQVTRVAVFMADVTGAKRMASQIMLLDKINSLGRMAAGIAHEIRNPLTGIHGYLYAMDEICSELPDEDQAGILQATITKIRKAAGKMESVIRRVLDFSKPGTPRMEPLDLAGPVQEALSLMAPTLRKAGITIETDFTSAPLILGDRMQLEQAVINITDNAARAMRSSATKIIRLSIALKDGRMALIIADSGPGIPQIDQERIFDPFFTTASDGTGIGLSIVQRIVADHGATISVGTSSLGGAEFRLEFPVQPKETA